MRIPLLTAILTLTTTMAMAQKPLVPMDEGRNQRHGFWIGFGLGGGSAGIDCNGCSTDRTTGLSGHLRLGGTLSQNLLLGVESNGWIHSEQGVDETLGLGTAVLVWYPSRTGAFFLKIGIGAMSYKASDGTDDLTATAPAGALGIGYDFRVGRNVSITPFLNSMATSGASFKINGTTAPTNEDIKVNLVQVGVGITFH